MGNSNIFNEGGWGIQPFGTPPTHEPDLAPGAFEFGEPNIAPGTPVLMMNISVSPGWGDPNEPAYSFAVGSHPVLADCAVAPEYVGPFMRLGAGCAIYLMQTKPLDLYTGEQVAHIRSSSDLAKAAALVLKAWRDDHGAVKVGEAIEAMGALLA